jgi:hypothetical protein
MQPKFDQKKYIKILILYLEYGEKPTHAIIPSRTFLPYKFDCCPLASMAVGIFSCHIYVYVHDQRHTESLKREWFIPLVVNM